MLCFQGEEEARGEVLYVLYTSHMVVPKLKTKVAMCEDDEVPDAGEHDPGDDERGGEAEQRPGPRQVDHRGEEVFEEPVYLYLYLYLYFHVYLFKKSLRDLCDS